MKSQDDYELNFVKRVAKQYELLLKMHDVELCVYCGSVGEDREHVVPYSWLYGQSRHSGGGNKLRNECIVMSCKECNGLAGPMIFDTFLEKKAYICERVRSRYSKLLTSPDWSEEEIEELTGKLKAKVYAYERAKQFIKLRLENLSSGEIPEEVIRFTERLS